MGADQNFSRNRSVGLYPKITANPSPRVCENNYEHAISQQHTLKNFAEAKLEKKTPQTAALLSQTSLTASTDRSDRLGWNSKIQTGQTGPFQTAQDQSFKRQILSKRSPNPAKLGGYLHTGSVNISPRDLTQKIKGSREFGKRSKWIGVFSRTQNFQFV